MGLPERSAPRATPRKPMACVRRVSLLDREIHERLSNAAIEILLGGARILSEGRPSTAATGGRAYFGSTMLTIDLPATQVRDQCDARLARHLADLMADDERVKRRVKALACAEAERLAGTALSVRVGELQVRAQGTQIHIDVDVEQNG